MNHGPRLTAPWSTRIHASTPLGLSHRSMYLVSRPASTAPTTYTAPINNDKARFCASVYAYCSLAMNGTPLQTTPVEIDARNVTAKLAASDVGPGPLVPLPS